MEIKAAKLTNWALIDAFLTKNLREHAGWSLRDEYPLAFAENNMQNISFIESDNQILAHAVMHPSLIKTHYHLFKVGFIGSVVTDRDNRGQGYSSELVKDCLQKARAQSCDFAMLWTDKFNFYSKFGFEVAGSEIAMQIRKDFRAKQQCHFKIIEGDKVAPQALLRVFNKHQMRSVRQVSDIQKHMKIPNSQIYTAWSPTTNQLEGYCVVGKGADFFNYIHEWGGNVSAILGLVTHILKEKQQPITLITPPQCTNLIKQLEQGGAEKFFGILGMIKILKPELVCKKIKKGARALGYDDFVFDFRDGFYYFGYKDEIYQTDSDQDMVRLIFGPMKPGQIHKFSEQALEVMDQIFPIPFWVWGWDSI